MKAIGFTLLGSAVLFVGLLVMGGMLGWYCAVYEQIRILNATGNEIEVTSAHTRKTIKIRDQEAGILPHSMGDITVKHPDGTSWVFDNISPDRELPEIGNSPYVTIRRYPVPFGGHSRTTGFMLDTTGHLYLVPRGLEDAEVMKKAPQPDGYPAVANEKRITPEGNDEDQFIDEYWARKANQDRNRGSEDRVREHLLRHDITFNRLSRNHDYLCILDLSKTHISNLSPLTGLPIADLDLTDTDVQDLSPLVGMPLTHLKLNGCRAVCDISPLQGMPLTSLSLVDTSVKDISPLAGMPITHLYLQDTRVTDIAAVAGMPLEWLIIDRCHVSDISALRGGHLEALNCISTDVADLSPLAAMPVEWLHAEHSKVTDTTVLRGMPLKWLHLAGTPITEIMAIEGMTFDELDISDTAIRQLPAIQSTPQTWLNLEDTQVSDLSFLQSSDVRCLYIAHTAITDVSALEGKSIGMMSFSPQRVNKGIDILRHMPSLSDIGVDLDHLMPAAEFWKRFDAGEFKADNE